MFSDDEAMYDFAKKKVSIKGHFVPDSIVHASMQMLEGCALAPIRIFISITEALSLASFFENWKFSF